MFESALALSAPSTPSRRRWTIALSFTVQAAILTALIALPLLHPDLLTARVFHLPLALPLTPPAPPAPPIQPVHLRITSANTASAPATLSKPRINRPDARPFTTTESAPSTPGSLNINMNTAPSPLSSAFSTFGHPHIVLAQPGHGDHSGSDAGNLHAISTGVSAGLLINPIRPVYPPIAIAAHLGGTVTVEATISTTGHVESAHATSGPIMLQPSAIEAVRTARYRPFQLNGQPTEVAATFIIHFNLSD